MSFAEEPTRPGLRQLRAVSDPPAFDGDTHELVGKLLAETIQLRAGHNQLVTQLQLNTAEISQLRRDLELDRKELVHSSARGAATHTSNRMAALLGALFVVYEQAAPYLAQLWHWVHK